MNSTMILGGIVVLGTGAVGALVWGLVSSKDRGRQRLATIGPSEPTDGDDGVAAGGARSDAVPLITQFFANTQVWQQLQLQLIRGGWMLRPSEFMAMCLGAGVAGTGLVWLITKSVPLGIVAGVGIAAVPHAVLKSRQQRRTKMLSMQLPDALDMLSGSLRSGFALLRAMQVVKSQMHPPIAEEFGRVVEEVQYGIPIEEALDNLIYRTGSYDLELIVAAVQTQLTVGGNLAEIFDNIAEMIRERVRLLGEVSAATAEGRLSAGILIAMPFVMAFLVNLMNPGYLAPLFQERLGLILVGVAVVLMILGALVMRKLIDIDV